MTIKPQIALLNRISKRLLMLFLFVYVTSSVFAQAVGDYRSAATGNWNTLGTWQRWNGGTWVAPNAGQGVPSSSSGVITILSTHVISLNANISVDQLIINSGGSLKVNSAKTLTIVDGAGTDLSNAGLIQVGITAFGSGTITISGSISNAGTIEVGTTILGAGTINNNGTITNSGTITLAKTFGSIPTFNNSGTITNSGTMNLYSGITFNNNATITNNGTFNNQSTLNISSGASITNNLTFTNSGLFGAITNNGIITNSSTATFTNSYTLTNNLTITNNGSFINSGTLSNNANGIISNNLTLSNTGTLSNNGIITNASTGIITSNSTFDNNLIVTNDGSISSSGSLTNKPAGTFTNNLTVTNTGTLTNNGVLSNMSIALITNSNTLINNSTLTNLGTITNSGTFTNNSTFTNGASSIYNHAKNGGVIPTASWNVASNCNITGITNTMITSGLSQAFGNLTWNSTSQSVNLSLGGLLTTVNGNFTLQSTNAKILYLHNASATLSIGGNFSLNLGTGTFDLNSGSGTTNVNVNGNVSFSSGTLTETGTAVVNYNFSGTSQQDFIKSGGTISNTINFKVLNNAIVSFGTYVLDGATSFFTSNSGSKLMTSNTNGFSITGATGSIQVGGTRTYSTGTSYEYNGTAAQITGLGLSQNTPANLTINSTNTVSLSAVTAISGNLLISQGTLSTSASNFNITLQGNWTNNGTFTANSATVLFTGTALQTIAGTSTTNFYDCTLNNSFGQLTLSSPINILHTFTLTSGVITTTSTNVITLKNGATTTIGSATSYVNGPLYLEKASSGATILNMPIGKNGDWRPVVLTVNHSNATSYTYKSEVFKSSAAAKGWTLPTGIEYVSTVRFWTINRFATADLNTETSANLSGNQTIKLYYGLNDGVEDAPYLRICKETAASGAWENIGGVGSANVSGYITSTSTPSAFNSFSDFALANENGGNNSLPIQLISFNVNQNQKNIDFQWETKSEINNDFFTVEYSIDGVTFFDIANIDGAGTSSIQNIYEYDYENNSLEGLVYFRLKQTDYDGLVSYSPIISKQIENEKIDFKIYPNPTTDYFTIVDENHDILKVELFNQMNSRIELPESNSNTYYVSNLSSGVYFVRITTLTQAVVKEIVVK